MRLLFALILLIGIGLAGKFLPQSRGFNRRMVLQAATRTEDGYVSSKDETALIGKSGLCISDLRPAGRVEIEGRPVDVVSDGDFIEVGERVRVDRVEGMRIIVIRETEST